MTNGGMVSVAHGSSPSFSCIPNSNKAVLTIRLDGTTVYTGSSNGATVSYTITNVIAPHTLAVTFG